jgi:PhnB protein
MSIAHDPFSLMRGVIPYLSIANAREAIAFYQKALGAELLGEVTTMPGTDKVANAALVIRGGMLMLADTFPEMGEPAGNGAEGVTMQLVVEDGDAWWGRAIAAGCTIKAAFGKQFWGDRYGQFVDPFGYVWAINEPSPESRAKAAAAVAAQN